MVSQAGVLGACGADSGRLKWNGWAPSAHGVASVPFSSGADGYACLKARNDVAHKDLVS